METKFLLLDTSVMRVITLILIGRSHYLHVAMV